MARAHWSPTQRACCHRVSRHSRHAPVRTHRQRGRAAGTCRSGRCAQSAQKRVRMRRNECQPDTRDRSHENEGSSAHHQQAFVIFTSFAPNCAPMAALSLSGLWLLPRTTSQVRFTDKRRLDEHPIPSLNGHCGLFSGFSIAKFLQQSLEVRWPPTAYR